MPRQQGVKEIASNRKAFHDYYVLERYEAGIELKGTEVKSVRAGTLNLKDSYYYYTAFFAKNQEKNAKKPP